MDATDSFYQWIHDKTMPGSRPSPKECYEAGYNNALAGIPYPSSAREHIEYLASECDRLGDILQSPETTKGICAAFAKTIADDLRALTAPSASPQQK